MRIACYNEKGGAGKTTTSAILGVRLELPVVDLDKQKTASLWLRSRQPEHPVLDDIDGVDHWVADCPPGITLSLAPVLAAADLVVIPVKCSFQDLATLGDTIRFVQSNSRARIGLVLSDIDSRTNDGETVREAVAPYGLPELGLLVHRAAYRRAGLAGLLPSEMDAAAAPEEAALVRAVKKLLKRGAE